MCWGLRLFVSATTFALIMLAVLSVARQMLCGRPTVVALGPRRVIKALPSAARIRKHVTQGILSATK